MKKIKPCVLRSCALQIAWVCLFFSLLPLLSGCTKPLVEYSLVRYDWFDTVVSVKGYEDKEEHFDRAMEVALPLLDTYHKLLDIYHTYEGVTNLATLNQMAGKGEVKVSKELMDFLLFSKEMHQKTNGKVNIAMGS
ncbi:MAG: FAD:protein FMN transferase, partial [Clostridia bacterium]|nr:FAD:protein FMN transferase [Clostridia bacterium]